MTHKRTQARGGVSALLFLALLLLSDIASFALGTLLAVLLHGSAPAQTHHAAPGAENEASYKSKGDSASEIEHRAACFAVAVAAAALDVLVVLLQGGFFLWSRGGLRNIGGEGGKRREGKREEDRKRVVWLIVVGVVQALASAGEAAVLLWVQGWAGVQMLGATRQVAEVVLGSADAAWVFAAVGRVGFVLYAKDLKMEENSEVGMDLHVEKKIEEIREKDKEASSEGTGQMVSNITEDEGKAEAWSGRLDDKTNCKEEEREVVRQQDLKKDNLHRSSTNPDAIVHGICEADQEGGENENMVQKTMAGIDDTIKPSYVTVPEKLEETNDKQLSPPEYSPTSTTSGVIQGSSSEIYNDLDEAHIHPLFRKGSRDALLAKGIIRTL